MKSELNPREQNNIHTTGTNLNFDLKNNYDKALQKVQVVGIINVTPDSYFDGGCYNTLEKAIDHGKRLLDEGADYLDIGGESTRPFADPISLEEELSRTIPVVKALAPIAKVSIDTQKAIVAKQAIDAGATMINDVSGFTDPKMCEVAGASNVQCCVMHSQGSPQTMQIDPKYPNGVLQDIACFFEKQIKILESYHVAKERIILDPGFGFGKTVQHCYTILGRLDELLSFNLPLYIGLSRKSFLQKTLNQPAQECLPATLTCATVSVLRGVSFLRVHDVKAHSDLLKVLKRLKRECF